MARNYSQCSERLAKILTEVLLGDPLYPIGDIPAYTYFRSLDVEEACWAYEQIYDLPEWDREEDIKGRIDEIRG